MIWIEEPEEKVTVTFEELTVIESITTLEPETFNVYPPTERIVEVVTVTSFAARARVGAKNALIIMRKYILIIFYLHDVDDKVNVVAPVATDA